MFLDKIQAVIDDTGGALSAEASSVIQNFKSSNLLREDRDFHAHIGNVLNQERVQDFSTAGANLFTFLDNQPRWISLLSLSDMAATEFGLERDSAEFQALEVCSVLGEIENDNPFHGNAHYKKVFISTMRQIARHNEIYRDTELELDQGDICALLSAECVHDLGHDGQPNGANKSRLEKKAIELTKPFLEQVGVSNDFIADLETIIRTTDVNPPGDISSPAKQAINTYAYYCDQSLELPELDSSLKRLIDNPKLSVMTAMFCEADLMQSVAYGYNRFVLENCLVAKELEERGGMDVKASPEFGLFFLNNIADRFHTKAGRELNPIIQRLKIVVENDKDKGVDVYNLERQQTVLRNLMDPPHAA